MLHQLRGLDKERERTELELLTEGQNLDDLIVE